MTRPSGTRVLGVDPGSLVTGWGVLSGSVSRPHLEESGAIRLAASRTFAERLGRLGREMDALVSRLRPDVAAVETPFQGASARSALQLAHARGVILAVLANHRIEVVEYTPATVKKAVTGSGRADKQQIGHVVRQLLGRAVAPGHDTSDALAIGLCHLAAGAWRRAVTRSVKNPSESGESTDAVP